MATYQEIQDALKAQIPPDMLRQRQQGGQTLTFLPWYNCSALADERAPGWTGEARVENLGDAVAVIYRIVVRADDGDVAREAIGYEPKATNSYGDPTSNAEAMAFRRAWAKHGLGASLYGGDAVNGGGAAAAGGSAPTATGSNVPGWNGLLWYGSCKGKHLSDPSVDIRSLEWGANNAKNKDGSPNEQQRAAIREEIARRQGGGTAPLPIATTAPAPASAPSAPAAKAGTAEMKALLDAAKAVGQNWADVKDASVDSFGKEPSQLAPEEVQLLLLQFVATPF